MYRPKRPRHDSWSELYHDQGPRVQSRGLTGRTRDPRRSIRGLDFQFDSNSKCERTVSPGSLGGWTWPSPEDSPADPPPWSLFQFVRHLWPSHWLSIVRATGIPGRGPTKAERQSIYRRLKRRRSLHSEAEFDYHYVKELTRLRSARSWWAARSIDYRLPVRLQGELASGRYIITAELAGGRRVTILPGLIRGFQLDLRTGTMHGGNRTFEVVRIAPAVDKTTQPKGSAYEWMLREATAEFETGRIMKQSEALKACCKATGSMVREAAAAHKALPVHLRRGRGRPNR